MNARGALQLLEYQVQDDYALSPELEDAVAVLSDALDERERLLARDTVEDGERCIS